MLGGEQKSDVVMLTIGAVFLVGLVAAVAWYLGKHHIITVAAYAAWYASLCIDYMVQGYLSLHLPRQLLDILVPTALYDYMHPVDERNWIARIQRDGAVISDVGRLQGILGIALRPLVPFAALAAIIAIWKNSGAQRLTTRRNIFTLSKLMVEHYPSIAPALQENLLEYEHDKGPFRQEASPIRFGILEGFIFAYRRDLRGQILYDEKRQVTFDRKLKKKKGYRWIKDQLTGSISKLHGSLAVDTARAETAFINQLGPRVYKVDDMDPYIKALYAVFMAYGAGEKKRGIEFLHQFNRSWRPATDEDNAFMDTSGTEDLILEFGQLDDARVLRRQHAFTHTLLVGALEYARRKGVLITSDFLWLMPYRRDLFFALNQAGGQTAWSESAGVWAHYEAETHCGGALYRPRVTRAVAGFQTYLRQSEGWLAPDPEQTVDAAVAAKATSETVL